MNIWVSGALALLAFAPAAGVAAPCRPQGARSCLAVPAILDLTTVPDISRRIVAREPAAQAALPRAPDGAGDGYTGPTVGFSRMGRGPTVGYHWSLH